MEEGCTCLGLQVLGILGNPQPFTWALCLLKAAEPLPSLGDQETWTPSTWAPHLSDSPSTQLDMIKLLKSKMS